MNQVVLINPRPDQTYALTTGINRPTIPLAHADGEVWAEIETGISFRVRVTELDGRTYVATGTSITRRDETVEIELVTLVPGHTEMRIIDRYLPDESA